MPARDPADSTACASSSDRKSSIVTTHGPSAPSAEYAAGAWCTIARGSAATLVNIAFTLPWTAAGVSPASRAHAGACVRSQARQVHAHSSRMFGFV